MTWAGTRSAVFERMCSTPAARSASWRLRAQLRAAGVEEVARDEVEEVLPRALGAPVAEALELLAGGPAWWPRSTKATISSSRSRASPVTRLDERVGVGGDEVQRPRRRACARRARRAPAPTSAASCAVADLRAAEHAHAQDLPPLGDRRRRSSKCAPQASARRAQSSARAAERRRARLGGDAVDRRPAGGHASAGGSCSTRSGRRRASGRGRRGRTPRPAGRRASSSPLSYQRRRRAGASTASHSSSGPIPARVNSAASWPMTTIVRARGCCRAGAGWRR